MPILGPSDGLVDDDAVVPSGEALLSSFTVQVKTEQDIIDEFGSSPWTLANVNLQVLENITVADESRFIIDTTSVTIYGVDRNSSSITGNVTGDPLFDFTGSGADLQLRINNMTLTQNGTGDLFRMNGLRFILILDNCGMSANFGGSNPDGGNINLLNGQLFSVSDGVLQGGASIIQGDGTTTNPGVEFMIMDEEFLIITNLFTDDQRTIEFMPNSVVQRVTCNTFSSLINPDFGFTAPRTGGIGMYFHASSSVKILDYMDGGFSPIQPSSSQFVMEDPASVKFGLLEGNTFSGAGNLYECRPQPRTVDPTITLSDARGLGFDGANLLAVSDNPGPPLLVQYTLLTSTPITSFAPAIGTQPIDIDWFRGDMIHLDALEGVAGTVYRHAGFTQANTDTVDIDVIGSAITTPGGLTTDGTHIILCDAVTGLIEGWLDFFGTPVLAFSFIIPGISNLRGLGYDGVNILATDQDDALVLVLKGTSQLIQYTFASAGATPSGVTVTGVSGYAESDAITDFITLSDASPTFDQSAVTWEVRDNIGEREVIGFDPIDSTLWTSPNSGLITDDGTTLTVTNGAAESAIANLIFNCLVGRSYLMTTTYTGGDAGGATFSIRNVSEEIVTSGLISVASTVVLEFVADQVDMTFRIVNDSFAMNEVSTITSLTQLDEDYRVIESSDKGGSIFNDATNRPLSPDIDVLNDLFDITDVGEVTPLLLYGPFTTREKSRLSDEFNGTIIFTSARDRGQTFQGSIVAQALGSASDSTYELLVTINGEPQEDSVGSNVWNGNNQVETIVTQAITRDVTDGDEVKLQVRQVSGTLLNLGALRCALSHNE